jgi:Domain of unknown function (DUF4386)
MKTHRITAIMTGILFLIAAVASIIGLILYKPILNDAEFIVNNNSNKSQILWGAFFEIITAFAVIGTPITLFSILKEVNLSMAIATICFRLLEATIIIIGIISLLTIISLNQEFAKEVNPNPNSYLIAGKSLLALHNWTFLFGPNVALGPSTLITSYLLFKSKLVPRIIAILGLIGGPLIFLSALFVMFGFYKQISVLGTITAIPVFFYEMSLAFWLLVKGFDTRWLNSKK